MEFMFLLVAMNSYFVSDDTR